MTIATGKMTAAEFLQLPEAPEGERWELVKGEIVVSPRPNLMHGNIQSKLIIIVGGYVEYNDLGVVFPEVDTVLGEDEVRIPDVLYYAAAHAPSLENQSADVIPDLCIEILSPNNPRRDRVEKFELYQSRGVSHYWIVDPNARTIEAYSLAGGKYALSGRGAGEEIVRLAPFPDLEIAMARLWRK